MAFVYIVMKNYQYEGDDVLGVYSSMISAETRKNAEQKKDRCNEVTIEKHEVN